MCHGTVLLSILCTFVNSIIYSTTCLYYLFIPIVPRVIAQSWFLHHCPTVSHPPCWLYSILFTAPVTCLLNCPPLLGVSCRRLRKRSNVAAQVRKEHLRFKFTWPACHVIEEHLEQLSSLNYVSKLCQEHSGHITSHELDPVSVTNDMAFHTFYCYVILCRSRNMEMLHYQSSVYSPYSPTTMLCHTSLTSCLVILSSKLMWAFGLKLRYKH